MTQATTTFTTRIFWKVLNFNTSRVGTLDSGCVRVRKRVNFVLFKLTKSC